MLESSIRAFFEGPFDWAAALGLHPQILSKLADRALAKLEVGQTEVAIAELSRLAQVDTISPIPPFTLGAAEAKAGEHERAISSYTLAEARALRVGFVAILPRIWICRAQSN